MLGQTRGGLAAHLLSQHTGERVAIHDVAIHDTERADPIRYDELARRSARAAAGLAALGVRRREVVALHLPNGPDFAVASLAALRIGATLAPCPAGAPTEELARAFRLVKPRLVVTGERTRSVAECASDAAGAGPVISTLPERDTDGRSDVAVASADPAVLALTSGTSGPPKAAVLTHGRMIASLRHARCVLPITADDVLLALAPFAHIMGLWGHLFRGLAAGCTVVTMRRFAPGPFLRALEAHRVTQMIIPPSLVDLLAHDENVADHDLSALRVIYVGGAGAHAELERACAARLGCVVAQGYGMTEAGPMIAVNPADRAEVRFGSAGRPLPDIEVRVVNPDSDVALGPGRTGEIWVRSPFLMAGYLDDRAATTAAINNEGWLRTGDLGRVDDDGYLWLMGRTKDLIKCQGHQVSPVELEEILRRHPAVLDAVVVGRPDRRAGEVPVGFVTVRDPVRVETLLSFVAARVSPVKRLRSIQIIEEFPRNDSGKIPRRHLLEQIISDQGDNHR